MCRSFTKLRDKALLIYTQDMRDKRGDGILLTEYQANPWHSLGMQPLKKLRHIVPRQRIESLEWIIQHDPLSPLDQCIQNTCTPHLAVGE